MNDTLDEEIKNKIRQCIIIEAEKLLGVPYDLGAEWTDISKPPSALDCSELVEGLYRIVKLSIPDGSQSQFNFTQKTDNPKMGDLAFFGKGNGDPNKIYHVGIVFDDKMIIEARAFDKGARFKTGEVILRDRQKWEQYCNFAGYRCHPKLA